MSRIGKKSIPVPAGVAVRIQGREVSAQGPKGTMSLTLVRGIELEDKDGHLVVSRTSEERWVRAMHGTTRALVANMVTGVSAGFTKVLQVWGVGYSAEVKPGVLSMSIGFCHKVEIPIPKGLDVAAERISIEGTNVWKISVSGISREAVGQLAADIRRVRPPEPYKGKGIRYEGERILRKAGKSFQSGG